MKFEQNSVIGIISPSGPIKDKEAFYANIKLLEQKGFRTKVSPNTLKAQDYLAGCDNERLDDLHGAFQDNEVDIILCARGGYGALRLLDKIDYNVIKNNPKPFFGSSDATALLAAFYARAGLRGYHSLMLMNGFLESDILSLNFQKEILPKKKHKVLIEGEAQGILWGGNLSTIVSLFGGGNYLPDEDIVMFLEDINEPLYKIDRMLTQIYRNKDLKNKIKALVFGEFLGLNKEDNSALNKILFEFAQKFNVPCVFGYDITHGKNNITLPYAAYVKLVGAKICLL